jgi:hypothetical protein
MGKYPTHFICVPAKSTIKDGLNNFKVTISIAYIWFEITIHFYHRTQCWTIPMWQLTKLCFKYPKSCSKTLCIRYKMIRGIRALQFFQCDRLPYEPTKRWGPATGSWMLERNQRDCLEVKRALKVFVLFDFIKLYFVLSWRPIFEHSGPIKTRFTGLGTFQTNHRRANVVYGNVLSADFAMFADGICREYVEKRMWIQVLQVAAILDFPFSF